MTHLPRSLSKLAKSVLRLAVPGGLKRRVKAGLRPLLIDDAPRSDCRRASAPDLGMNVVGYLRAEFGIGESARCCVRAAQAAGIPLALHDFNAGNAARADDDTFAAQLSRTPLPGVNVCHVNAEAMPLAYATLGRDFFADRYTVGYWAWEQPEFPDRWLGAFALVDEVWVPSTFCLDAIGRRSPVPVVRMPHAIACAARPDIRRGDFGLPERHFLFLMMYDAHSFAERKNPRGAIEAFRRAFPNPDHVSLVVKVNHPRSRPGELQALRDELTRTPGVILLDRTLTRQEVYDLQSLCDAYVSLHRAEGFGFGMAEAMHLGKPVIATHWSGNLDFMTPTNSCPVGYELVPLPEDVGPYEKGQPWAEPDLDHAAWHMARLVANEARRREIALKGQATIRAYFSPAAVGAMYRGRLNVIRRMMATDRPTSGVA